MSRSRWLPLLLLVAACGGGGGAGSAGPGNEGDGASDSPEADAGVADGRGPDATSDAGAKDGAADAGATDSAAGDTGASDAAHDAIASDGAGDGAATDASDGATGDSGATDGSGDAPASDSSSLDAHGDGPSDAGSVADVVEEPVCSGGATGCSGATPESCSGGQWVLADASCSGPVPVCLNGGCVACTPGVTGCSNNVVQTCGGGGSWTGTLDCTAISQTCSGGACIGMCAPGQTQCASGNSVDVCDGSGQWANAGACVSSTCVGGQCVGVCSPGQTQCSGNGVQTCNGSGGWGAPSDCGALTCFNGQCDALTLAPLNQTIQVTYGQQTPTVQYTAYLGGQPVGASFSIDHGQVGSIVPATGLMTPTGTLGGLANVTATYQNQKVSTTLTVALQMTVNGDPSAGDAGGGAGGNGGVGGNGPGGTVDPGTVGVLNGTPAADPGLAWLYPYDKTMWPQGLLAPLLQWTPGAAGSASPYYTAVSIHIVENGFNYQGHFAANAAPFINLPVDQIPWDVMAYSNGGEAVTVSLVFASNGKAYGPITETWKIAPGTLKGTVYYNSYGTNLATNYCCTQGGKPFGGATLAIKHGATSPTLVAGTSTWPTNDNGCRVCHSVSADGSKLVTQHGENYATSSWYALANYAETTMNPQGTGQFAWPALSPDGSMLLANGAPLAGGGQYAAQLFNTLTGAAVPSTGIPVGLKAGSPVFSPDGKHVAFTFTAGTGADGRSLAAMDFDPVTKTFSNFRVLYTPASNAYTALWPTFMPTNDAVIFELQVQYNGRDWGGTRSPCDSTACANQSTGGSQGEMWYVDLATRTASRLDTLNGKGYAPTSASHANDAVLGYEPTISPVASGGEAWVVFTTRRLYGNVATLPPYYSDPRYVDLTTQPTPKKLWVAAVDLNPTPGTDGSHPAFYLPGQELLAGNSRGYWVVDPCQADGTTCQSGDECCGGYCASVDGGLVCTSQPPSCSQLFDKCVVDSDCCGVNLGITCINGRCSQSAP